MPTPLPAGPLVPRTRPTVPRTGPTADLAHAYSVLSRQVRDAGLLRRTRTFYFVLLGGLSLALAAVVTGVVLLGPSWWQLALAAALGLVLTQFAFVAHEAAHRQVLVSGPANDRLGRLIITLVVGMSYSWWMRKHSRHHANPNQQGKDPDIGFSTISFVPEAAAAKSGLAAAFTRHQGTLFFPLLTLEGVNLHVQGIRRLVSRENVRGRWLELSLIAVHFAAYLTLVFVVLPVGMGLAFVGVQLAVFGVYMGASFAPNHKGMPVLPKDSTLDFLSKQVRTSRNIAGGWWAAMLLGGLNYQVEHHLFPSMPRPHLARARLIVREHCAALGVPYTETTLWRSYGIVVRYLNQVGLAARDPFECPVSARYR